MSELCVLPLGKRVPAFPTWNLKLRRQVLGADQGPRTTEAREGHHMYMIIQTAQRIIKSRKYEILINKLMNFEINRYKFFQQVATIIFSC